MLHTTVSGKPFIQYTIYTIEINLLAIPQLGITTAFNLLLQLKNTIKKGFGSWRTSGDVDIYGDHSIATANHRISIMVIASTICTGTHRNNPLVLRHLVVDTSESGSHLVRESSGDENKIGLKRFIYPKSPHTNLLDEAML